MGGKGMIMHKTLNENLLAKEKDWEVECTNLELDGISENLSNAE